MWLLLKNKYSVEFAFIEFIKNLFRLQKFRITRTQKAVDAPTLSKQITNQPTRTQNTTTTILRGLFSDYWYLKTVIGV